MYCGKCGKEIKNNDKICVYCGSQVNHYNSFRNNTGIDKQGIENEKTKVFSIITLILVGILVFAYLKQLFLSMGGNIEAFDWVNKSAAMMGYFLLIAIPGLICGSLLDFAFKHIAGKKKSSYASYLKMGGKLLLNGILLWFGSIIFSDWSHEDMSIVLYRVFSTYDGLIGTTFIFAIIFLGLGFLVKEIELKH